MSVTSPLRFLRRCWRRLGGRLRRPLLTLVYDPGYEQCVSAVPMDPARGEKVLRFLSREGLLRRVALQRPRQASLQALLRVHSPDYLESLQDPTIVTRIMGQDQEMSAREAERVQDLHRLMTGGTLRAVRAALRGGGVAMNLGGGFHHAGATAGMGFCLFNDVAVAIADARSRGFRGRVLVVDLDVHDGNGTREIFAGDDSVHTYSIHGRNWGATEARASTTIALGESIGDPRYLATLEGSLPSVADNFAPDLVLYLAGTDPAAGDALGDWCLSPEALLKRDRIVIDLFRGRARSLPLVVLLAGGYGADAWRHTARSLGWFLSGEVLEPPDNDTIVFDRLHRIGDRLRASDFASEERDLAFSLSEEDLVGIDPSAPQRRRFLGLFSHHGVELLLERFGLLGRLRDKGFDPLRVAVDADGATGQTLRVLAEGPQPLLVMELRVRRSAQMMPGRELLVVEWLLLQDPRTGFSLRRQRLPGQQHPGLGLLREVLAWLAVLCEMLGLDGIAFTPSHYHVAVQSRRLVRFVRPADEARMRACSAALDGVPLARATRLVEQGRVVEHRSGKVFQWRASPMVLPVSRALKRQLYGEDYEQQVASARRHLDLRLITAAPATA